MSQFIENLRSVKNAASEDFQSASTTDKLRAYGAAALWPAHELGMETALAAAGTHTLEFTHNALAVGAAMGALSLSVETTLALLIAHNIETFKGAVSTIAERYYPKSEATDQQDEEQATKKSKLSRTIGSAGLALSLGSPGVMLEELDKQPPDAYEHNKRVGLRAGRMLAGFNFLLGVGLAGSGWVAEQLGTNAVTDAIISVGESPFTYISIFSAVVGPRLWKARKAQKNEPST